MKKTTNATFEQALENLINVYNSNASDEIKENEYNNFTECYQYYDTSKLDTLLNI